MLIVGDCHSYVEEFNKIIATGEDIIQLGDLLIGLSDVWQNIKFSDRVSYIAGNHDHPYVVKDHPNYLGRFGYLPEKEIFYISGALSPDYRTRTPYIDVWPEEQLNHHEFVEAMELYKQTKPKIVLSHESPNTVAKLLGYGNSSLTQHALEMMTHIHQPELWLTGHYHVYRENIHNGIKFICLPILGTYKI